jgi:hypothetical protein
LDAFENVQFIGASLAVDARAYRKPGYDSVGLTSIQLFHVLYCLTFLSFFSFLLLCCCSFLSIPLQLVPGEIEEKKNIKRDRDVRQSVQKEKRAYPPEKGYVKGPPIHPNCPTDGLHTHCEYTDKQLPARTPAHPTQSNAVQYKNRKTNKCENFLPRKRKFT